MSSDTDAFVRLEAPRKRKRPTATSQKAAPRSVGRPRLGPVKEAREDHFMRLRVGGMSYTAAVEGVATKFGISFARAKVAGRDAMRAWASTHASTDLEAKRAITVGRLEEVFRQALDRKRYRAAISALELLGKIEGVIPTAAGNRVVQQVVHLAMPPEFEGRSEHELEHYATHGLWPEERPQVVAPLPDPLAGLDEPTRPATNLVRLPTQTLPPLLYEHGLPIT